MVSVTFQEHFLYANREDPDQTQRFAASDLDMLCFPMSHEKTLELNGRRAMRPNWRGSGAERCEGDDKKYESGYLSCILFRGPWSYLSDCFYSNFSYNSDLSGFRRGQGTRDPPFPHPLENHKYIEFLSNTGPDLLEHYQVTKSAFNVGPSSAH